MTLERFGTRLDDYLDGTLDAPERREIDALLDSSPEARRELAEYRQIVDAVAGLPESIEPERDLLPAIEERLDRGAAAPAPPGARRWLLLAASLATALGLGYLATRTTGPEPGAPAAPAVREAGLTATSQAENDLVAASEELRRTLAANRAALPPETRLLVERNLDIIQTAIAEIQLALDNDPGNQELNRALVAYYRHELALLEQVNRAASRL